MKNSILLVFAVLLFASCQDQMKVGYVDNNKLVNDYMKKKDMESRYKRKIEIFNKRVDSIGKVFQLETRDFQQKAASLSQKAIQEQYQILGQKQQFLEQQFQQEEQDIQKQSQTDIDSLISEVRTYVKDYGKKNGYTYILGSNDAGSVMYGKEENDLTKELLDALNAEYKKKQ
uniref:OmpH family outer membrane protein n=1 Tax=Gelidibacter sp. TaxID=2018083 RepID=UPI00404978CE